MLFITLRFAGFSIPARFHRAGGFTPAKPIYGQISRRENDEAFTPRGYRIMADVSALRAGRGLSAALHRYVTRGQAEQRRWPGRHAISSAISHYFDDGRRHRYRPRAAVNEHFADGAAQAALRRAMPAQQRHAPRWRHARLSLALAGRSASLGRDEASFEADSDALLPPPRISAQNLLFVPN